MVNQQLLDFIKQQLQQGISQDQIKSILISNGWQLRDIEDGLNTINPSVTIGQSPISLVKPVVAMWKIVVVFLLGIIVVCGGVYFTYSNFFKSQKVETPVSKSNIPINTGTKGAIQSNIIDCGNVDLKNIDCFINAAKNCSQSKVTATSQLNLFGVITDGSSSYEIRGLEGGKCVFYIKSVSAKVTYGLEITKKMLDGGATNEQIKQQEQVSSKAAQLVMGKDGICKFNSTVELVNILNKWEKGSFSTDDFKNIDCSGEYFGQGGQLANTSKTITQDECYAQKGGSTFVSTAGTACFKNQIDLGTITGGYITMGGKNPQCCVSK